MVRLLGVFVLSAFLLMGCQSDKGILSTTPTEALNQVHLEEAYAKPSDIYEMIEVEEEGNILAVLEFT